MQQNVTLAKPAVKEVKISEIKRLLTEGYTRFKKQREENINAQGSIEEYFTLDASEVREIFKHPKLKGLKTKIPTFVLVDDEPEEDDPDDAFVEEAKIIEEVATELLKEEGPKIEDAFLPVLPISGLPSEDLKERVIKDQEKMSKELNHVKNLLDVL